jgi:uncharacterized membrane protein
MPKRKRLGIDTADGSEAPAKRPTIPAEIRERVIIEPGQPLPPEIISLVAERVEGPLPSPRVMKLYAEIVTDLPDRIVSAWEKESSHRRELQRKSLDLDQHYVAESLRLSRLGVHYAFIISLVAIAGGIIAVVLGAGIGGWITLGGLAALVYAFIRGTNLPPLAERRNVQDKPSPEQD